MKTYEKWPEPRTCSGGNDLGQALHRHVMLPEGRSAFVGEGASGATIRARSHRYRRRH